MPARHRVGLIGAGRMGSNHARALAGHPRLVLAAVADRDPARAAALGQHYDVPVAADAAALAGSVDAVVIATSSASHAEVARRVLAAGRPCLIEKPLALTEADCLDLVVLAASLGIAVVVGLLAFIGTQSAFYCM